jgi:hypothetical protein
MTEESCRQMAPTPGMFVAIELSAPPGRSPFTFHVERRLAAHQPRSGANKELIELLLMIRTPSEKKQHRGGEDDRDQIEAPLRDAINRFDERWVGGCSCDRSSMHGPRRET